jgi:rod shape-determining protein MreD
MGNGALGVLTFTLLLVYAAIASRRRFFANRSLAIHWAIFVPLSATVFFLLWLFNVLIRSVFFDPNPVFFQFLLTLGAFPICAWIFARLSRRGLRLERA